MVSRVSTDSPLGHLEDITNKPRTGPGLSLAPAEEGKENEIPAELAEMTNIERHLNRKKFEVDPEVHTLEHTIRTWEFERQDERAQIAQLHEKMGVSEDDTELLNKVMDMTEALEKDAPALEELYQEHRGIAGKAATDELRAQFSTSVAPTTKAQQIKNLQQTIKDLQAMRVAQDTDIRQHQNKIHTFESRVITKICLRQEKLVCLETSAEKITYLVLETRKIQSLTWACRQFLSPWRERVINLKKERDKTDLSLQHLGTQLSELIGQRRATLFMEQSQHKFQGLTKFALLSPDQRHAHQSLAQHFRLSEENVFVIYRSICMHERDLSLLVKEGASIQRTHKFMIEIHQRNVGVFKQLMSAEKAALGFLSFQSFFVNYRDFIKSKRAFLSTHEESLAECRVLDVQVAPLKDRLTELYQDFARLAGPEKAEALKAQMKVTSF